MLPADHVIRDVAGVSAGGRTSRCRGGAQRRSSPPSASCPTSPRPATATSGAARASGGGVSASRDFVEKPDAGARASSVASGEYYWNSGMFLFRARRYLEELEQLRAGHRARCARRRSRARRAIWISRASTPAAFEACRSDSIDYAVMEKTADAVVVPLDAGWSDVGSWASLHDGVRARRARQRTARRRASSRIRAAATSTRRAGWWRRSGLRDHVVVETKDAVLVAPQEPRAGRQEAGRSGSRRDGRYEHSLHREVFRPWGSYDSIENGERFQVKRLMVKPGGVLSLQMHHHRAEHWVVVSGTARITRGEEMFLLEENQSTYIPIGVQASHRESRARIPLHIIEVQSGCYLGEDDIVRFEDRYGRQGTTRPEAARRDDQPDSLQGLRRSRPHSRRAQRDAGLRHRPGLRGVRTAQARRGRARHPPLQRASCRRR